MSIAKYVNIPVSPETFEKFLKICATHKRKQGAQVDVWVEKEYSELALAEAQPAGEVTLPKVDEVA